MFSIIEKHPGKNILPFGEDATISNLGFSAIKFWKIDFFPQNYNWSAMNSVRNTVFSFGEAWFTLQNFSLNSISLMAFLKYMDFHQWS